MIMFLSIVFVLFDVDVVVIDGVIVGGIVDLVVILWGLIFVLDLFGAVSCWLLINNEYCWRGITTVIETQMQYNACRVMMMSLNQKAIGF